MNEQPKLPIDSTRSPVPEVPAFGCIVYVRPVSAGRVIARVANLAGIEIEAANERDALTKIVPLFKSVVQGHLHSETTIPWIDPPSPIGENEQKRFLPVHL
jgi:hypothetical protein